MNHERRMTIGELKELLKGWPDDYEITFSAVLEFNRLKKRGDKLVDMEFNQTVYKTKEGEWRIVAP